MVADFFTKPLQGRKFKHFRKMILNLKYEKEKGDKSEDKEEKKKKMNKKKVRFADDAIKASIGHRSVLE